MKRTAFLLATSAVMVAAACKTQAPPPAAKAPAPVLASAPPPAPARPVDGGTTADARGADARLGMMERHAIWKAKKEATEKAAAELAAKEKARLIKFDKSKLAKHEALLAFERKTRQALDQAAIKLNGKLDGADQLKKLAVTQQKAIEAQSNGLRAMDPEGGNSFIATDHDVILQLLGHDYPAAILSFFQGQTKPLAEVRAEIDRREKKINAWLEEVRSAR
jgi:hypothetical protein